MAKTACPRAQAALVLKAVLNQEQSMTEALKQYKLGLSPQDAALYQALCYGVCRYYFSLNESIGQHLQKPLRGKDYDILALLLLGAYQLHFMRLPDYAAINSCVEASKTLNKNWAKGLINAVLRKVQNKGLSEEQASSQYQHPDWFIGKVKKAWPEQYRNIFSANNQQPPFCLRVNQLQSNVASLQTQLAEQSISSHQGSLSTNALYLDDKPQDITEIAGFNEGLFSVQDEAAQCCAELLEIKPNQHILDACAAPGGKTCHILELNPDNSVIAIDIDDERLARVEENLERLNLHAETIACDVSETEHWFDGKLFDRILCDAPCSATGVIRRHPDIKLLRRGDDIKPLVALQAEILDKLWPLLKPGGILLYATCSILPEENSRQIKQFLARHDDATELAIELTSGLKTEHGWQLFASAESHDGFYYAKLQKHAV